MKKYIVIMLVLLLITTITAGCKDITDRYKPASFGNSREEQAMVEALKEKYGDLTQPGDPRFLEVRMTTKVENQVPIDTVTEYAQSTSELFLWFVYDNFNEDEIQVEWIFSDDNYSIHTFAATTGVDFGRGTFILEQPTDGWPTGNYEVIIRGRGIESSVRFKIVDGPTVASSLEMVDGKIDLAKNPGWYFIDWDYIIAPTDVTVVEGGRIEGRLAGTSGPEGLLYDYYESSGGKNNFSHSLRRTSHIGKLLHRGACNIQWSDPEIYLEPGRKASIDIIISVESSWGVGNKHVYFDATDIKPGYGTAGTINFATPDGRAYLSENYSGKMESVRVIPEGKPGEYRSIIVSLGNGYGFVYKYEWRE